VKNNILLMAILTCFLVSFLLRYLVGCTIKLDPPVVYVDTHIGCVDLNLPGSDFQDCDGGKE
jgi:hypothetical protein